MPFIQKEGTETAVLNCNLWDWSLLAQMGEAHQFSQIILYFTRKTSLYHKKEGHFATRSHSMYNRELYILKNKFNPVNEYLLVCR